MLNPFFLQGSPTEQSLIQDLINEQIRMYGVDIHYLPRKYLTTKTVLREVIQSAFNEAFPLEAYIESYEGYGDNNVILSKFGIQATNELTLTISKDRFQNYISPLINNMPNIVLPSRPKEGDVIYFPLGDRLFEIKFVEHEQPFYQLQKTYVYTLKCELFRYEDEVIDTNIREIDDNITGIGSFVPGQFSGAAITQTLSMIGIGETATATASVVYGGVSSITVTNRGGGYKETPVVAISSAPSNGLTATASATMISGIVVCNSNVDPNSKSVQSVQIINAGYGYSVAPGVKFIGGEGSGATAVSEIGDGIIGSITLTNPGSGYTTTPNINFVGIASTTAIANAILSPSGSIISIDIVNAGLGYTEVPQIIIDSPAIIGFGTYIYNEIVTGSSSQVTARVRAWNGVNYILEVSNISGEFIDGETLVGSESGASYAISMINTDNIHDAYADNSEIQIEANDIIDFSELNPFGTP